MPVILPAVQSQHIIYFNQISNLMPENNLIKVTIEIFLIFPQHVMTVFLNVDFMQVCVSMKGDTDVSARIHMNVQVWLI